MISIVIMTCKDLALEAATHHIIVDLGTTTAEDTTYR